VGKEEDIKVASKKWLHSLLTTPDITDAPSLWTPPDGTDY